MECERHTEHKKSKEKKMKQKAKQELEVVKKHKKELKTLEKNEKILKREEDKDAENKIKSKQKMTDYICKYENKESFSGEKTCNPFRYFRSRNFREQKLSRISRILPKV